MSTTTLRGSAYSERIIVGPRRLERLHRQPVTIGPRRRNPFE
jgi:hypothetical protein